MKLQHTVLRKETSQVKFQSLLSYESSPFVYQPKKFFTFPTKFEKNEAFANDFEVDFTAVLVVS